MEMRQVLRDEKEQKLLEAARGLFLEHGYAGTSMDQVAHRASASKTTLYTRFPSKDALFQAVIKAEADAFGVTFAVDEFAGVNIDAALREIGRRFVDLVTSPQAIRLEQVLMAEGGQFPEAVQSFYEAGPLATITAVTAFIAAAMARGDLAPAEPRDAAELFLALLKGCSDEFAMVCRLPPKTADERAAYRDRAVALFLDGARRR